MKKIITILCAIVLAATLCLIITNKPSITLPVDASTPEKPAAKTTCRNAPITSPVTVSTKLDRRETTSDVLELYSNSKPFSNKQIQQLVTELEHSKKADKISIDADNKLSKPLKEIFGKSYTVTENTKGIGRRTVRFKNDKYLGNLDYRYDSESETVTIQGYILSQDKEQQSYIIEGSLEEPVFVAKDAGDIMCSLEKIPAKHRAALARNDKNDQSAGSDEAMTLLPLVSNTKPSAAACIYLNFDGEIVNPNNNNATDWNNGNTIVAAPYTDYNSTEKLQILAGIAEDYAPWSITVTNQRSVYNQYSPQQRIQVIITPSSSWFGSGAGVAFINSFDNVTDIPCWGFPDSNYNVKDAIDLVSHEVGHTLGLYHDGASNTEYYLGHGTGLNSWAPIMGVGYYAEITQWSWGEYEGASNTENDLSKINRHLIDAESPSNPLSGYLPDDNIGTLTPLDADSSGAYQREGLIGRVSDVDVYKFSVGNGAASFSVTPNTLYQNLNPSLTLAHSNGTVIFSEDTSNKLHEEAYAELAQGTYYLTIGGVGEGDPTTGYSDYGSLGHYVLTGAFTPPGNSGDSGLNIAHNGISITHNDMTPSTTKGTLISNVILGNSATRNFVITNSGNARLILGNYTSSNPDFSIDAPPYIDTGQSEVITIIYTPSTASDDSASLTFSTNAPSTPLFRFELLGTVLSNVNLNDDGSVYHIANAATLDTGDSLSISSDISNYGTTSSGSFEVAFYLSSNNTINSADYHLGTVTMSSIGNGLYNTCTLNTRIPTTIPTGSYYLGWIIDPENTTGDLTPNDNMVIYKNGDIRFSITSKIPPEPPTILTYSDGNHTDKIVLTWSQVSDASEYKVFYQTSPSSQVRLLGSTSLTQFIHSGLPSGVTYYYFVRASNANGNSANSNTAAASTITPIPPEAPTILSYSDERHADKIALTWSNIPNATEYKVFYQTSSTGQVRLLESTTRTQFVHSGLPSGVTYYYFVRASNANGNSANSNKVAASTITPIPPEAPTILTYSDERHTDKIALTWSNVATASAYKVFYRTSPTGQARFLGNTTLTQFVHNGLPSGVTYYYFIRANNANGNSENSNTVAASTR